MEAFQPFGVGAVNNSIIRVFPDFQARHDTAPARHALRSVATGE
jgi:hypothetical protein